ncbi:phospholipid-transporting ATPase ABCA1-like [Ornithodoros turicata]|uniref:phospholipid-transporting ATPase ABCA1-like n=1 Tax=Ornithodoros turicata TaxID=34597 RepID=UPI003139E626
MGNSFRQLYIILWKNVYISGIRRHYSWTVVELLFVAATLYGVWNDALEIRYGDPVPAEVFPRVHPLQLWPKDVSTLIYTPNQAFVSQVMRSVSHELFIPSLKAVSTADEVVGLMEADAESKVGSRCLAIVFEDPALNPDKLPEQVRYHIRYKGLRFDINLDYLQKLELPGPSQWEAFKETTALLPVLYSLEKNFLQVVAAARNINVNAMNDIQLQRFPYPRYYTEEFDRSYTTLVFRFGTAFLVPFTKIVARITGEKCSGMRELLRIAGTNELVYWGSHFLSSCMSMTLMVCVAMLFLFLLGPDPVVSYSDPALIFIVLLMFSNVTVLHAMFLSVLLTSSRLSIIFSLLYWTCCLAFPYSILQNPTGHGYYLQTRASKVLSSVFPCMGLHWSLKVIERYERFRGGLTWSNFNDPSITLDNISVSDLMLVNLATCLLMTFLIWYTDNIIPWGPGIHRPMWFPFMRSYWAPQTEVASSYRSVNPDPSMFENDPTDIAPSIQLVNIKKTFYGPFLLHHINLKIFRHQITVLLGPCGSGKSTMINIITGLVLPSSGAVIVENYNVVTNTSEARELISYCPPHNVLFNELTVEEHLLFFAMLKGMSLNRIRQEINLLLADIQMPSYMHYLPPTLADGMRRLLCVAITLLVGAKCKIMVFDQPTVSMDPSTQREVWELLLKARRNCCILIATQNLAEANALADKIAIVNKGLLWCCGSPSFLRDRFGAGYCIRIHKDAQCNSPAVEELLRKHIPQVTVKLDTSYEAEYAIGPNPGTRRMVAMFKELDKERDNLKIASMSVMVTTLEDVLNKATQEATLEQVGIESAPQQEDSSEIDIPATQVKCAPPSGTRLFTALLAKRFHQWNRDWHSPIPRWVVPVAVLLLSGFLQLRYRRPALTVDDELLENQLSYIPRRVFSNIASFLVANAGVDGIEKQLVDLLHDAENIHLVNMQSDRINSRLLDYAEDNPRQYVYQLQFGYIVSGRSMVTIWFNGQCPHSAPLAVSMYHTAVLRNVTGSRKISFVPINKPFMNDTQAPELTSFEELLSVFKSGFGTPKDTTTRERIVLNLMTAVFVPLSLCFHAASFVVYPISERITRFKHLQLMTGLPGSLYWFSNFTFDVMLVVLCAIPFIPAMLFNHRILIGAEFTGGLFVLFLLHGVAVIPFTYLTSPLFHDGSLGLSVLAVCLFIGGTLGSLERVLRQVTSDESWFTMFLSKLLDVACGCLPTYTLTRGVLKLRTLSRENQVCNVNKEHLLHICRGAELENTVSLQYCCQAVLHPNSTEGRRTAVHPLDLKSGSVTLECVLLLLEGLVLLTLVSVMETENFRRLRRVVRDMLYGISETTAVQPPSLEGPRLYTSALDSDVREESTQVEKACTPDGAASKALLEWALVVRKLTKRYGLRKSLADVSFLLKPSQCLGIIGVTGAGKTEMMQMLTGVTEISSGDAYIGNASLTDEPTKFLAQVGYCPETLGLPDHMTGRQLVTLFSALRGVPKESMDSAVANLLALMDLGKVADHDIAIYTQGDRRKLSIGIAIVGTPKVVFLDEPGTGVDVSARSQISRSLTIIRDITDISIVLTSNSIRQCEVLCDRIALLLSGQFECIGTVDELKSKFGRGYTITVKTRQEYVDDSEFLEDLTHDMKQEFHNCELDHSFQGILEYRVGTTYTSWSEMFSKMASIQKRHRFKEFYVSDTTLEQIFVSYARKQINFSKAMAMAN